MFDSIRKASGPAVAVALLALCGSAAAQELTPIGAERAANAAGTIPEWTGGITTPPQGYRPGMHHPDPFAADQPLLTITAQNAEQHQAHLSPGQLALLRTYPTYKMIVYPTRRSASFPQRIYDATLALEGKVQLSEGGNGLAGAAVGVPFRRPDSGLEVIWNHVTRYRGDAVRRRVGQAAPTRGGAFTLVRIEEDILFNYHRRSASPAAVGNLLAYFMQQVLSPPRLAGDILLVHETLNQVKEARRAWVYNTGQRRVRRAPNVAYDNPGTASDAQRTSDQLDLFNGAPDRYDWKLVGKREVYIPYNSYRLHSNQVRVRDIVKPLHINQDLARYELHRVWVVEATLKSGASHIYKRRTFYVDEDSWQIMVAEQYDARGQMWRVSEGHSINYYEVPTFWTTLEVHYDLQNGRYLAFGLDNEEAMYDFGRKLSPADFTPEALRQKGMR
jgi:hypothetical protein